MEARTLKTLLGALTAAGVTSYKDADVSIEFGPTFRAPEGDVDGIVDGAPPDPPDWRAKILKTYERAAPRKGAE